MVHELNSVWRNYNFLVRDNYISAKDTFWSAWSDNSIRQWLIEYGYMRSDAQIKRDELIKLANEKYVRFRIAYLTIEIFFKI